MSGMRWAIGILIVAAVTAVGCGKGSGSGDADFQRQREALAPKPTATGTAQDVSSVATEAAAGETVVPERYGYDPLGKRDPFRSFVLDRLKDSEDTAKGPLEQFELSQLDLLGVVWDTNRRRALVGDPSGQGYIVSEGDAVGKNDGQVIRIDDNLVLVREKYVDYVGEETTKEIEMRVRQGQGG